LDESKFSKLKPIIIDKSSVELSQCLSSILTANHDGEDTKLKLEIIGSKNKSESSELFNDKQKDLINQSV
jgi:hypothetical protein